MVTGGIYPPQSSKRKEQKSAAVSEFKLHFPEFGSHVVEEKGMFGRQKFSFDQEGFESTLQMASDGKLRVNTEGMHDHMVAKPEASPAEMNALAEAAEMPPKGTPMKAPGTNPTIDNPWG